MEPRVQYAQTKDGVSIAYWKMGDGPPVIHLPPMIWGHLQLERANPEWPSWHDALAERLTLVRFDIPGTGLSDRDETDFSLTRLVEYVDAVADHLGLDRFALLCPVDSGPLGITYSVERSERVSHLVLYCAWATVSASGKGSGTFKGARRLLEENWEIFVRTSSSVAFGWTSERAAWWADFMQESVTHENYLHFFNDRRNWDATDLLEKVTAPTQVIQRRQVQVPSVAVARGLAAKIPDAHLAVIEGDEVAPYLGDMKTLVETVCDFVAQDETEASDEPSATPSPFRAVLFTDIVGHTEMMSHLGDDRGRDVLREHERITREVLFAHGGTEIKTMGDGFMASFGSVTKSVECAIALQRAFAERDSDEPLHVRAGINAGEPIEEDGDLFGATVILASRIAAKAEGGEILVADTVRGLCSGKGFLFADRGEFVAKGFEDPVRLFEVSWRE
jgi:class 3 adenylate cyclase